jgi:hypothetical protein
MRQHSAAGPCGDGPDGRRGTHPEVGSDLTNWGMQIAYRWVVAPQTVDHDMYTLWLAPFLTGKTHCVSSLPPPGWLHSGGKRDVPHGAAAVAHCGSTYVWVMPEDVGALTQFTYFILNIATVATTQ